MSDLCCWQPRTVTKITIFPEEAALDGPLPAHRPAGRKPVMEWLSWQVDGPGPMAGQNLHFGGLRTREDPLFDRPLRQGDQPALRCHGSAICRHR